MNTVRNHAIVNVAHPALKRRRQPMIFWTPIIATAVVSAFFIAGFLFVVRVLPVGTHARNTRDGQKVAAKAVSEPPVADTTLQAQFHPHLAQLTEPPQPEFAAISLPTPTEPPSKSGSGEPASTVPDAVPVDAVPVSVLHGAAGGPQTDCKACAGIGVAQTAPGTPAGGRYGTQVDFIDDPTEAANVAIKEKKLLLVLHIAGNFEDNAFT
jgi:hypothetical protein